MKVHQEEWSPDQGWSTINDQNDLYQANIVICKGTTEASIPDAIYKEIKHAFPNAAILFTFSGKTSSKNKLHLSVFTLEKATFSLFQYDERKGSMEVIPAFHCSKHQNKSINQMLICSSFSSSANNKITKDLLERFTFNSIEEPKKEKVSNVGLNSKPGIPMAIGIAFYDSSFRIETTNSIISNNTMIAATSVAAQATPTPSSLRFIESGDHNPAIIPVNYTFLLKR